MFDARIHVALDQVIGRVHPHLYGTNLEHIGRSIYGGVWAEMLIDRKFAGHDRPYIGMSEGLAHQNPGFGIVTPWEAVHPDHERVLFVHDNTTFYTGAQSQRITIRQPDGGAHGIQQRGLRLHAGRTYDLRLVLRGEGQAVTVTLGDQAWTIPAVSGEWTTFTHALTPTSDETDGALAITITSGSLWIGCASLMPADHILGFRPDVVAALKQLKPEFLRWPGGNFASGYHWQQGIGDRDRRPSYLDPAWKLWESNDVGTDEFVQLCMLVDTEPVLTINMGDGTVEEAVAWLEYCKGDPNTHYGALRRANGYTEDYHVRTWFVGNEQFGNWQVGHVDAETYARRYLEFARAMRAVDPDLLLIAVGVPTDLYGHWNELVLKIAGREIDELSVHYYSIRTEKWDVPPPAETLYLPKVASAHEVELMLDRTLEIVAAHSDPPVPIAFDEWNTYVAGKAPDFFEDYSIADALYTGALMNACLRRADRIQMSAIFNVINVMGNIRVTPDVIWMTPSSLVIELMTRWRGSYAVAVSSESPTFDSPAAGNLPAFTGIPLIDAAVTLDRPTGTAYLTVVNRDPERAARIDLTGLPREGDAALYRVAGDHPLALNDEQHPHAVTIEEAVWPADQPLLEVPPHSFTLARLRLDKSIPRTAHSI